MAIGPQQTPLPRAEKHLLQVLLDELHAAEVTPLSRLPEASDPRLQRVVHALRARPDDARGLGGWADVAAASPRTLARLFQRELGMSFGTFRSELRLRASLERLAAGESVTTVALSLGYESTSAFIAMFRRHLGQTPTSYFRL